MKPGTRNSFLLFSGSILVIIVLILCSGCTVVMPGSTPANKTKEDPVTGTWNGFSATSAKDVISDPAVIKEIETMRLNIYQDRSFAYTSNFTIRNGTLIPTGKGNYVVKANETDTERKYFHYNEDQDVLTWESRDLTIEFRRNDRSLTSSELSDYNTRMLELFVREQQAASVTPVPLQAVAHIVSEGFGFDPTSNIVYQMNGDVEIETGIYKSVVVILRYPDQDSYQIDVGGMGGSNMTKKDIKIILNERVFNQTPGYFIRLDSTEYPATFTSEISGRKVYTAYEHPG
jgi:hypothetical protein